MKLQQKRLWDFREFTLLEKEVLIRMESPLEDIELKLKYEDLGFETAYVRKKTLGLILFGVLIILIILGAVILNHSDYTLSLAQISMIGFSLPLLITIGGLISYVDRKPQIVIKGGKESFSVLADSPTPSDVNQFIGELHEKMTQRIIDIEIRPNDPKMEYSAQKEALEALLDNEVISRDKFEEMIKLLKEKQKSKPAIGF